jgi:hypothetical protein
MGIAKVLLGYFASCRYRCFGGLSAYRYTQCFVHSPDTKWSEFCLYRKCILFACPILCTATKEILDLDILKYIYYFLLPVQLTDKEGHVMFVGCRLRYLMWNFTSYAVSLVLSFFPCSRFLIANHDQSDPFFG